MNPFRVARRTFLSRYFFGGVLGLWFLAHCGRRCGFLRGGMHRVAHGRGHAPTRDGRSAAFHVLPAIWRGVHARCGCDWLGDAPPACAAVSSRVSSCGHCAFENAFARARDVSCKIAS